VEDGEPALKPFLVTHLQDMKSSQTVSNRGGNCKMKTYFAIYAISVSTK
jgi:hypothetical protein